VISEGPLLAPPALGERRRHSTDRVSGLPLPRFLRARPRKPSTFPSRTAHRCFTGKPRKPCCPSGRQGFSRTTGPELTFRDGHHIAGRLMTLVLLWAGTVGCPMKVGGLRTSVRVPSGSPVVHAAKPPGIPIHRPGCICRKAAGDSHPPQAARGIFIWFHLLGPVV
jgi:hypothetical protein